MVRPTGTVTLLFSDIAGSSRMWEQHPDLMESVLERHDRSLRHLFEQHGGYVFKTIGDAFCVAFSSAVDAASAAIAAQHAVKDEVSTDAMAVTVRMALHSGTCQERDDDYFGPTVNRTARLMSTAHGGQIVVSSATAELLGHTMPVGVNLIDLGEHRLRDLGRPEHIFQLHAAGLTDRFGPLNSLDSPELPNNLPALLSPFVGRANELEEIRALIGPNRLVTLTGAGGAGKTRLAVQVAAEMIDGSGDGVWLVELAPLVDESQIPLAIAAALGVREGLEVDPVETLQRILLDQRLLLVLDNCEHLVEPIAKIVDSIMRHCPKVHVLATSREPLGIDGERVYRVPSMGVPDWAETLDDAVRSDAVSLFVTRALDVGAVLEDRDVELILSVCRRLDGIPLALELAAARLSSMSMQQLSERLDQRFRLLTGGSRSAMARQQTLQALVDWSYSLLSDAERTVLQRMSVFVGGFDLDAAEKICVSGSVDEFDVVNHLHSLTEKSMLIAEHNNGRSRYRVLETIRQYGASELLRSVGDEGVLQVRDLHARHFVQVAERLAKDLESPRMLEILAELDADADNIRAALHHLASTPEAMIDVLETITRLKSYFLIRGAADVIPLLYDTIPPESDADSLAVVMACCTISRLSGWILTADRDATMRSFPYIERATRHVEQHGDPECSAEVFGTYSMFLQYQGLFDECAVAYQHAQELLKGVGNTRVSRQILAWSINRRIADALGYDNSELVRRAEELMRMSSESHIPTALSAAYANLAHARLIEGNIVEAKRLEKLSFETQLALGAQHSAFSPLNNYALFCAQLGENEEASWALGRLILLIRRCGIRQPIGDLCLIAGALRARERRFAVAAELLGASYFLSLPYYETGQLFPTEDEELMRNEAVTACREALGDEEFERIFADGAHFDDSSAMDLILRSA